MSLDTAASRARVLLRPTYRSALPAIESLVLRVTEPGSAVHTDGWPANDGLDAPKRQRVSVEHKREAWARDVDGDGVREVHANTDEGFWRGLRNDLRPFRGVSAWCLDLAFEPCMHDLRRDGLGFPRASAWVRHPEGCMSRISSPSRAFRRASTS